MQSTTKIEYGDFQTPDGLARRVVRLLVEKGIAPDVVVEPTCGKGSFVRASSEAFPSAQGVFAFEINADYVNEARMQMLTAPHAPVTVDCRDFFTMDWDGFVSGLEGSLLVVGNPPWVTNSALSSMGSENLPKKSNFQQYGGFAAKTGKANFDISEWMLIRLLEALRNRDACLAMLCKTSTARKVLRHAWRKHLPIRDCSLHTIDAAREFEVSVDACLFIVRMGEDGAEKTADVYPSLGFDNKQATIGWVGGEMVADVVSYQMLRDLDGLPYYTWRSGVKHDAAAVMEFRERDGLLVNGKGETVALENTYLFPLLKSSDVANGRLTPTRFVLLPQKTPSDDTAAVRVTAPLTWDYLCRHGDALDKRRSVIYAKRPRFAIFGIGEYTFAPWKVAVSGLYKTCRFEVVGSYSGKPIVLDDTCYFISCATSEEAHFIARLLNSDVCQQFIRSLVFFDSKRPITVDILNRIDLKHVADRLGLATEALHFLPYAFSDESDQLLIVFERDDEF
jgi:Type I restriction-modification system methyltransferase subunit